MKKSVNHVNCMNIMRKCEYIKNHGATKSGDINFIALVISASEG